ncbi:MAG: DNA polymerase III subunit alpha [Geminicoccaceae bacterium]
MSRAYLEGDPGEELTVDMADIEAMNEGLIMLTGGAAGPLARLILAGEREAARDWLGDMRKAFGDRLYVEVGRHGETDELDSEEAMLDLAFELDVPLVATNDVHFIDPDMHEAHDALICIAESTQVIVEDRRRISLEYRFKSQAEMIALFADLPEAIANTVVIARRCAFAAPARDPILPPFDGAAGRDEAEELRAQARDGLEIRIEQHAIEDAEPYRQRLEYELDVIVQMKFPGYFLIVSDFIKWGKAHDIPVGPGRGSGAGSVVAWSLQITDLDPLRFGLLFERFLNPERVSMPDFDIDFCMNRRDEVIAYVQEKYGRDKVAAIITFGKLQARAALRDVGRVLGLPFGLVDRISKMVPFNPANPPTLAQALDMEPRWKEARREDPAVDRMIEVALKLEGLPRHAPRRTPPVSSSATGRSRSWCRSIAIRDPRCPSRSST